jgi:hypothetical protein
MDADELKKMLEELINEKEEEPPVRVPKELRQMILAVMAEGKNSPAAAKQNLQEQILGCIAIGTIIGLLIVCWMYVTGSGF